MSEVNAIISSTHLGNEDHGIPTAMIQLSGEGWGQGFGGYNLRGPGMSVFVMGVLDALEVSSWEKLKGVNVRIRREGNEGWDGKIVAIGHIVKDRWFNPAEAFEKAKQATA